VNWRGPLIRLGLGVVRRQILRNLRFLESVQYRSAKELQCLTEQLLVDLLRHASQKVPYYAEILPDLGVVRDGKVNLDHFAEIPFLTREIVQREGDRLYASDRARRGFYENRSGGSTGQPLAFIQDRAYEDWSYAGRFFCNRMLGKDVGDAEVSLWGSERDLLAGSNSGRKAIKHWLFNLNRLNSFLMDDDQMSAHALTIARNKPVMLAGYVDSLFEMARFAQKHEIELFQPRFVLSQAGTLTEATRQVIARAFGAPVYNFYGSREMSPIACECTDGGLHILSIGQLVEVVDVRDGWGDLAITGLINYAMPFIRYRIGDKGALHDGVCTCGRTFPLLRGVAGRSTECFRTRNGQVIPPQYFVNTVRTICRNGSIGKFQFVQRDFEHVTVRIVVNYEDDGLKNEIRERLQLVMGNDCKVNFEAVDDIPPLPSGKYLYTISDIAVSTDFSDTL
jgi:phenylacetate-coenzyme A ligase PaaK-like adenylate-forming protein